ncbi:MAG: hypothetical protein FJ088_06170 [Deltaproteobacteria bacterium]|nr:hypothetical protein [Deltaproteobacteria bacterium]
MTNLKGFGIEKVSLFFNRRNAMRTRILSLSALSLLFLVVYIISPSGFEDFQWAYLLLAASGSILASIFLKTFVGMEKDGYIVIAGESLMAIKDGFQRKFNLMRIADPYVHNEKGLKNLVILDLDSGERVRIPVDVSNPDDLLEDIKTRRNETGSSAVKMEYLDLDRSHARTVLIRHEYSFSLMILLMAVSMNLALSAMPLAGSAEDKILAVVLFAMLPMAAALGSRVGMFWATAEYRKTGQPANRFHSSTDASVNHFDYHHSPAFRNIVGAESFPRKAASVTNNLVFAG